MMLRSAGELRSEKREVGAVLSWMCYVLRQTAEVRDVMNRKPHQMMDTPETH